MLGGTYRPSPSEHRMAWDGDWGNARRTFLEKRPANLDHLLRGRYAWMNNYIRDDSRVVEVGAGAGYSNEFLRRRALLVDVLPHPWSDIAADALRMPFRDGSIDILICCHTLHHVARPPVLFAEAHRVLAPGGHLLIQELHTSLLLRLILRLLRHEGWSYEVDVFNPEVLTNDPDDPASANCAIPELLFGDPALFETRIGGFEILRNEPCEVLVWLLSGGVNAKVRTVKLGRPVLRALDALDTVLAGLFPSVLALGRRIALRKVPRPAAR